MILYFSGTGNSKYVAKQIAEETKDEIVSLNSLIKKDEDVVLESPEQPFVFVCPTYAWRIPEIVNDFIEKTEFKGSKKVYFVLTCGGETEYAINYTKRLCEKKGWELCGFAEILLPDNYIVMFPSLKEEDIENTIAKAQPVIKELSKDISNGLEFQVYKASGLGGKLKSKIINKLFYKMYVNPKGFYVLQSKCVSCGLCAKLCPLNTIELQKGLPVWGDKCTHCMACINNCPEFAIEYKNKTQGKLRYLFRKPRNN